MKPKQHPARDTSTPGKGILLIIDGLGDLPVPDLQGKTPLEAAHTPLFDRLAGAGLHGLVHPTGPGETPHTHSGSGALMGLSQAQASRLRRGPVEAAGAGLVLTPGEVAIRANFATIDLQDGELLVTDRRAGRITSGTHELAALLSNIELGDGVSASLIPTNQHRGVLVMTGPGLNESISDTDPGGESGLPAALKPCRALVPEAVFTATKVDAFLRMARLALIDHPVNRNRIREGKLPATGVITRGAGLHFEVDNILDDLGITPAVVSGCNTVLGVGRLLGFHTITDTRFTATLDTDLDAKIATAISALADHDLVYVHVKAPDICSHDRHPRAKRDFLQRLDTAVRPWLETGALIAVAADHTTDSNTGSHTADPVPALIYEPGSAGTGEPVKFGETTCRQGNMARQSSHDFLTRVMGFMTGGAPE